MLGLHAGLLCVALSLWYTDGMLPFTRGVWTAYPSLQRAGVVHIGTGGGTGVTYAAHPVGVNSAATHACASNSNPS